MSKIASFDKIEIFIDDPHNILGRSDNQSLDEIKEELQKEKNKNEESIESKKIKQRMINYILSRFYSLYKNEEY